MDGYFEYSLTGHMKRLSWQNVTEISTGGGVDDSVTGAVLRIKLEIREFW